jgi:hypothetical protein
VSDDVTRPEPMFWTPPEFERAMELWSQNVMKDQRPSRGALRVAWGLTFHFNRLKRCAWPSRETLAKEVGLSEDRVRACLIELRKLGHLFEGKERPTGTLKTVWRPVFNGLIDVQSPRPRKGGKPPTAVIEGQSQTGLNVNQETGLNVNHSTSDSLPLNDLRAVQGLTQADDLTDYEQVKEGEEGLSSQELPEPCSECGKPSAGKSDRFGNAYCAEHIWMAT